MAWHVTTELPGNYYMVENPVENLPIDLIFKYKYNAQNLADWLNKKDNWTERLEYIIEYETEIDLEKLKEKPISSNI